MVVKTMFSDTEFKDIFQDFNVGDFISAEPILNGTVQTNYLVTTSRGKFVFKFYNNREYESVLCETEVLDFLTKNNFSCPHIVHRQDGNLVTQHKDRSYVLYEFAEGEHHDKLNDAQFQSLIKSVADMHKVLRGFVPEHVQSRMNYSPELCIKLAEGRVSDLQTPDAQKKLEWLKDVSKNLDLPENFPKEISHGDLFPGNFLFKGDNICALLDFDDANYTYSTFDLAGLIEHKAWIYESDKTLDWDRAKWVVHEYIKHIQLSMLEMEHLFDVYKVGIMIDSIWNYERGSADDFYEKRKIDFLDKIGRKVFYNKLFS